jgi:hypothetical protein
MFVSFPLLEARRMIDQAIATSGVSELEHSHLVTKLAPTIAWRTQARPGHPYLNPAPVCPECGTRVVRASACLMCPGCGWGKCG